MKIRVASRDAADSMLAHEDRGVHIVKNVAGELGGLFPARRGSDQRKL